MRAFCVALLLCATAVQCRDAHESGKDRTITKVVKLLQEMLGDSQKAGTEDRDLFAKYKCYCDTTTEEKTNSIAELTKEIAGLEGKITMLQGESGKLSVESSMLQRKIDETTAAQATATSIREKANADFISQEKDMVDAVAQMEQAIEMLSAIGSDASAADSAAGLMAVAAKEGGEFLAPYSAESRANVSTSVDPKSMLRMSTELKRAMKAASVFLDHNQKKLVTGFLQAPFTGEYSAQSGEIVGILTNMRDTFKANLQSARAAEAAAVRTNKKYEETMDVSLTTSTEALEAKQELLGSNDDACGTARESLQTAQVTLAEDQDFLASLTKGCALKTTEYEDRKLVRANEEAAISQAISILNSDSAFDTFGGIDATSTGETGPAFVQIRAHQNWGTSSSLRVQLARKLRRAARKSQRTSRIALMLDRGNPFDVVTRQMKKQMRVIDKEEKADDEQKAWCDSERTTNGEVIDLKERNIKRLTGEINKISDEIENPGVGLKTILAETQADLKSTRDSQTEETRDRQDENLQYQKTVANMVAAEKVLEKAIGVLTKFYDWLKRKDGTHHYAEHQNKDSGGHGIKRMAGATSEELQVACSADPNCAGFSVPSGWLKSAIQSEDKWYDVEGDSLFVKVYDESFLETAARGRGRQEPDAGPEFGETQHKKGGDAVGMLQFILKETNEEERVAHETEEGAQAAYEDEMSRLTAEERTFVEVIGKTEKDLAEKEKIREEKKLNKKETVRDKKSAQEYLLSIKPGCDFLDQNLDLRKESRRAEKSAMQEAIHAMEETPEYKELEAQEELESFGECRPQCEAGNASHVTCKACLAETTEAGYCASHPGTEGCEDHIERIEGH